MSFRAKSRAQQWALCLGAALAGLAAYVVLSRILYGSMSWNIVLPRNQRIVLPILALFWLFAWETRWDGVERKNKSENVKSEGEKVKVEGQGQRRNRETVKLGIEVEERNLTSGAAEPLDQDESDATRPVHSSTPDFNSSLSGEELYAQARTVTHQAIPDFDFDGPYLELLGQSAAKGHAPALAKLGEYAMRRRAWVEAYYWMKQAQRNGMHGLAPMLREIRKGWAVDGFPWQSSNINALFSEEAGSLGRALLCLDSGHDVARAREFLKAYHPEFLS